MAFTDTWNLAYEGLPPDNENINLGAGRIRDLKLSIRERLIVNHSWAGDANDGKHVQVELMAQGADPATVAAEGWLYTKTVLANVELFYKDSSGAVLQLTSVGKVNVTPFPSGTKLLFPQATVPTGWTQDADVTDVLPRVVSGAGGGATGGSWTISGCSVATTVTTTTTTNTTTATTTTTGTTTNTTVSDNGSVVTVAAHALTVAELPAMAYNTVVPLGNSSVGVAAGVGFSVASAGSTSFGSNVQGSNNAHNHVGSSLSLSLLGSSLSTSTSSSTSTSTSNSSSASSATSTPSFDGTWRPAYLNVIKGNKT